MHKIGGVYLVNPGDELQLLGSTRNANDAYEWTSANATVQACFVASGPYVIVPSGCLESQRQYTLQLTASTSPGVGGVRQVSQWCSRESSAVKKRRLNPLRSHFALCTQVIVRLNEPPVRGNCTVAPNRGMALVTTFTLACQGWSDTEGHYPLAYSYMAARNGW